VSIQKATVLSKTSWVSLLINHHPDQMDPDGYRTDLRVQVSTQQYLGDEEGNVLQMLSTSGAQGSRYMDEEQAMLEVLGEVVTREDGTQCSLFDILNEKLVRAIEPLIVKE